MKTKIVENRNNASDKTKKTKYADPSYNYVPMKKAEGGDD